MKYTGSIKKRLILIILLVATLTSLMGYGSFVYWYMNNQYERALNLSQIVGNVIAQDVAKLILLNDVAVAAEITSHLKSFTTLDSMILYKLNKQSILQYNKSDITFKIKQLPPKVKRKIIVKDNKLKLYIDAVYQNTHLGYVQLDFKIDTVWDVIKQNISKLIFILFFTFIMSYLLAIFFAKRFTNPILELVAFLEKIVLLDSLSHRIKTNETNEYGRLYKEINTMLERIQTSHESLKIAAVAFETQNGMTITDANNTILQVNKAFTKITGYTAKEAVGKTPAILKSGIHDKEFYDSMHDCLRKNSYWTGEITNIHKNGNILKEHLTIQVVVDENNIIKYYIASFSDITLQKETEYKLKETENIIIQQSKMAAMGEMLENIAHQWRQPLSLISTIVTGTLAKREFDIPIEKVDEIKELNQINSSTQYLSQTIDNFRNFFKQNKKKVIFNLKDSYYKTFNLVEARFKALNIEVIEHLDDIELCNLDNELMQAVMNILNNAGDALATTDQRKIIFINIYKNHKDAVIVIKDNAGGIPENIMSKICEPYFTTKHQTQGTGIGLYMSREMIIKHMKGTLEVHNTTYTYDDIEYKGACFSITIPID